MNQIVLSLLRCIWGDNVNHPYDVTLKCYGDDFNGVLRCRGCKACFLLNDGIPIMLSDSELSKPERRLLKAYCKRFGLMREYHAKKGADNK